MPGRIILRSFCQNSVLLSNLKCVSYSQTVRSLSRTTANNNFFSANAGRLTGAVATILTGVATFKWVENRAEVFAATSYRPKYKLARQIQHDTDQTGLKLTLYQYQSCPFCCKVRAYLDYFGLSYDVVEVNSVSRKQIKWSKYKKVPILVVDGQGPDGFVQLNDSSVIISTLESFLVDRSLKFDTLSMYYPPLEGKDENGKNKIDYPNRYFIMYGEKEIGRTKEEYKLERKWRKWVDNHLVHLISPNVYRTPSEAIQTFYQFSEQGEWQHNFGPIERYTMIYVGAAAMYVIGKLLKRKYKLKEDVRESLYDACDEWTKAVGQNKFLGGDKPNLADLSVYGSLCSFENCDAFQDVLKETNLRPWFESIKSAVTQHQGSSRLLTV